MTQEEFDGLGPVGLQKLLKKLTGSLSISRNKPYLQKLITPLAWVGVSLADIAVEPKITKAPAARKAKAKAAAKPAPAKPSKKVAVDKGGNGAGKAKAAKPESTDVAKARAARDAAIRELALKGVSLDGIRQAAIKAGIKTARGHARWSKSALVAALERTA